MLRTNTNTPPLSRRRLAVASALTLATVAIATPAHAGGLSAARFGAETGHPTTANPTAIYYNPAGIALDPGLKIFGDINLALRGATYTRTAPNQANNPTEVAEPADAAGANNGTSKLFNAIASPAFGVTGAFPVSDSIRLAGGLGFFVPFGGSAKWGQNGSFRDNASYPGPVDGQQRWWTIDGSIRTMYISASLGISINDFISIGISGGPAISSTDTIRARISSGTNDLDLEGRAWLKTSGLNGHLGGGVIIEPIKGKLRIGLSYQAPPGFGRTKQKGKLVKFLAPGVRSGDDQDVELHQHLPDIFSLGASYNVSPMVQLRLFGNYQRWSLFKNQCIAVADTPCDVDEAGSPSAESTNVIINLERRWQDTFGVRAGASFFPTDDAEVLVGAGYDSNAIPDEKLDAALMDFDKISVSLGGRFRVAKGVRAAITYTHLFYLSRDTNGSCNENNPTDKLCGPYYPAQPSAGPDSSGEFTQTIGVVNFNLQYDLFGTDPRSAGPAGGAGLNPSAAPGTR